MLEYRYLMEKYLAEHSEQQISKKCLLDGNYLKPEYIIHHINLDTLDNRLKNFWVCKAKGHNLAHKSLLAIVDQLLKLSLLGFKNGYYYLNY
jgi:hypothetical protein